MRWASLFCILCIYACSSELPPSGGEKDSTPPKLQAAQPAFEARNFQGRSIQMQFDEYIKLSNPEENIVFSPPLSKPAKFRAAGRKLFVEFQEDLQLNTTYQMVINQAVRDLREGNVLETSIFVWSTGAQLDTAQAIGQIVDALTTEAPEPTWLLLYPVNDDSSFQKGQARYITQSDKDGNYLFQYLQAGQYQLRALRDNNRNYRYDQIGEGIAFHDKLVEVRNDSVVTFPTISLFTEADTLLKTQGPLHVRAGQVRWIWSRPVGQKVRRLDAHPKDVLIVSGDTIDYYYGDTIAKKEAAFIVQTDDKIDTTLVALNPARSAKGKKPLGRPNFEFKRHPEQGQQWPMRFSLPMAGWSKNQTSLTRDSIAITDYSLKLGENNISAQLDIANAEPGNYRLTIQNANYFNGRPSVDTVFNYSIDEQHAAKATLVHAFDSVDRVHVHLLRNEKVVQSFSLSTGNSFTTPFLPVGKYTIQVFIDENADGRWNTGNYNLKQQAERMVLYNKELEMRPGFDVNLELK